jgi:hypothetical protein
MVAARIETFAHVGNPKSADQDANWTLIARTSLR